MYHQSNDHDFLLFHFCTAEFGCLEWSKDESRLLYVAEKKQPKAASYFEKKKDVNSGEETDEDSASKKDQEVKVGKRISYLVYFFTPYNVWIVKDGIYLNVLLMY